MNCWLLLLQLVVIALLTYLYFNRKFRYWSDRGVPSPPIYTPLGHFLAYIRHGQVKMEKEWPAKYGKVYGLYKATTPALTITDPALIKQILVKDFSLFVNRGQFVNLDDPYWNLNLLNAEDENWKRIRAIASPSFSTGKLKKMHKLMEGCVDKLTTYMDTVIETKGGAMNAKEVITGFTIDVIASSAFGTETNANGDRNQTNAFVENGTKFFDISLWRVASIFTLPLSVNKWLGNPLGFFDPKVFYFFVNLSKEILRQRRGQPSGTVKRTDLVQLMTDAFVYEGDLEKTEYGTLAASMDNDVTEEGDRKTVSTGAKRTLTETEIISNCIFFLVAGFDTTSNTLTNAIYNLAVNPHLQERLHGEITQALDGVEDESEYFEKVNTAIPYLDAFIKETLRMAPPITRLQRQVSVDCYNLAGLPLEKGLIIDISVFGCHYSPDHFPEPEMFNPERFMPENRDTIVPYSYLPFGGGPRNCIGMRFAYQEIRLCLVKLVRRYRFEATASTPVPLEYVKLGLLTIKEAPLKIVAR